ncbi:hypothetical protein BH18VER2_BH18VER2_05360 [soil metagenome]
MKEVNRNELKEYAWTSPKGKFGGSGKELSEALGWDPNSPEARNRHPFAVEILRLAAGQTPYPYHSHAAQWEFYHVIAGHGLARDADGQTRVEAGDAFIYGPGEAHQLINNSEEDLVIYVVADNPLGESCYYPDSNKWLVRSPERKLLRQAGEELHRIDAERRSGHARPAPGARARTRSKTLSRTRGEGGGLGSAHVSCAGDGVPPSRTFLTAKSSRTAVDPKQSSSRWNSATSTRDACATRMNAAAIEKLAVSACKIQTDQPESDGTSDWDSPTIVFVEAEADGKHSLGYMSPRRGRRSATERIYLSTATALSLANRRWS